MYVLTVSSPWSPRPRCWKGRDGFSWGMSPWLGTITFPVCLLLASPVCVCVFLRSLPVLIRTPVLLDQGCTLMTSFNPRKQRKKVKSVSLTLCDPMDCSLPGSSVHGVSRQDTGVGCHFLLQKIFPTQRWNPGVPHCRQTLYRLSHQRSLVIYLPKLWG